MAEKSSNRKVLLAVDGSEHGDRAFDCKFVQNICPVKIYLIPDITREPDFYRISHGDNVKLVTSNI